jgi:hypothetical protein
VNDCVFADSKFCATIVGRGGNEMIAAEKIQQSIQRLPQPLQAQVLDFVEYLLSKVERESAQQEDADWFALSLANAMRGMENEEIPNYAMADLKVVFA